MTDINISFSRALLAQIIPAVRAAGKRPMKDGWVWHFNRDHWEFHGPDEFYWNGSAGNAYEARYKGWSAWLKKQACEICGVQLSDADTTPCRDAVGCGATE